MSRGFRPLVLVVDDEEGVRAALTLDLEDEFDVLGAPDGPSALALLRLQTVDVVLLDLLLPGVGGLEVLREIKVIEPTLPVIVVTGVKRTRTIVDGMRLGADDYITKPWQEIQLLAAVRESVARRSRGSRGILLVGDDFERLAPLHVALAREVPVQAMTPAAATVARLPGLALVILDGGAESARDGELLHALRDRHPGCAMLVTTPNPSELQLPPGIADVVAKPYQLDDVLHRIGVLLPVRNEQDHFWKRLGRHAARAAEYIERHYRAPIALRDVADFVGLSTDRLAHVFRDQVGMPMKEYATRLRVAVGCRLLGETDRKIEDIAQWLGFDHASHFSRVFVGLTGLRPGEYRRRVRAGDRAVLMLDLREDTAVRNERGWSASSSHRRSARRRLTPRRPPAIVQTLAPESHRGD